MLLGVEVTVDAGQSILCIHNVPCADSLAQSSVGLREDTVYKKYSGLTAGYSIFKNAAYTASRINIINDITEVFWEHIFLIVI